MEYTPSADWTQLFPYGSKRKYVAGTYLTIEGEAATDFYYVESGKMVSWNIARNGRKLRPMLVFEAGSIYNAVAALTHYEWLEYECYCELDTVLWRFPKNILHSPNIVKNYPDHIINLMCYLADRCVQMDEILSLSGQDSTTMQVARWILRRMHMFKSTNFPMGCTKIQLANMLGVDRTTLTRSIHILHNEKVISNFTKKQISIIDTNKLEIIVKNWN